jgi:hypothetical protein
MDLLKISITKDARIDQSTLIARLHAADIPVRDIEALLPMKRSDADNTRLAVSYTMRQYQKFQSEGQECRALAIPTKGGKGLDLRIHVQSRSSSDVAFTQTAICSINDGGAKAPIVCSVTQEAYRRFPDLAKALESPKRLLEFGEQYFFESDLRRLCEGLFEGDCVSLWPGLRLVLTAEARATVAALQRLLRALDAGTVNLAMLSLDNTPANREALARELGEGFSEQLEKLTERCGYTPPNVAAICKEYAALQEKLTLAEGVLGVEIPCFEAQAQLELALDAAQDAA